MRHTFEQELRASARAVERLYDALAPRLGAGHVSRDPEVLERYASDESGAGAFPPQLLARPGSTDEVAETVRACYRHGVPVVPRGGGTGRAGGALAIQGGLVLSLERLDRVVEIDEGSLLARAQPGVVLQRLHEEVEARRLFYPPDPNSLESCHLGGNIATNASGPRTIKYGTTRQHVLGLEVVLPGGEIVRIGRDTVKQAAGYDLTGLMVGSEGTLGVVTGITVRLHPKPPRVETALLFFPGVEAACRAVLGILQAGHLPRTLELMDPTAIDAVRPKAPFRFPEGDQAALILELDGDGEPVFDELARIAEIAEAKHGASLVLVARNQTERADLWASRRLLSSALRERYGLKFAEDVAVPLRHMPEMIDRVHATARREGIEAAVYGHAGDGNLHVNFLFREEAAWPAVMRAAETTFRDAVSFGGTITGEHGVGLVKRSALALEQAPPVLALQRRIKAAIDPEGLMNPGKVLPDQA